MEGRRDLALHLQPGVDQFAHWPAVEVLLRQEQRLQREEGEASGDLVREMIIIALPREKYEEMFETMVRWARFGNLFAYEDDADRLSLQ